MGGAIAKLVFKNGEEQISAPQRELRDIEILDIDGEMVRIGDFFEGKKAILFVNVATK